MLWLQLQLVKQYNTDMDESKQLMGGGDCRESSSSTSTSTYQRSSDRRSRTTSLRRSRRILSVASLPFSQFENGFEDKRRENIKISREANEEPRFQDRLEEEIREFG